MTQPESPESNPASAPASGATAEAAETRPEPEPWTPERVSEWNNYYDIYVTLGVLMLAFLVSANKITHSSVWTQLQVGRAIAADSAPVLKDLFSYTREGAPWVNIPWLFDWSHAVVHKTAYDLAPFDLNERKASADRAEQVAAGTLVALNALARLLTALVLLRVRREGPGRWWSAVCVMLALGAMLGPGHFGLGPVLVGGLAGPGIVAPATWGLLFLALEVMLIHRAVDYGRRGAAFALIPIFLLWANVDETFLVGLIVLAACVAGRVRPSAGTVRGREKPPETLGMPTALAVLAACAAVCLVNPSFLQGYRAAADPFLALFRPATDVLTPDQLSFFGKGIRQANQAGNDWPILVAFYLTVSALGFGSFYLNRRRFSLSRFFMYTVGVVLWGVLKRYAPEFSVLFASTMALNGQEWYHDRLGTAGRVGTGWSLWSVGGRAVTILVIFLCVSKVLLGGLPVPGFGANEGDGQFGFGYDRDDFAFEAADFLKAAGLRGNVLNTTKAEGDALIWRAYPDRKTYIDNREHLFPPEVLNRLQQTRQALSKDDVDAWKPLLDQYSISTVMVPPAVAPVTYQVLSRSANWVPFYDDGAVVLFGRADAPEDDLAFFNKNRLDPDSLAYRREKPTPPTDRPPTPVSWIDVVFQTRSLARPQPHTEAARHWLYVPESEGAATLPLPDPARCILAVREARTALASKPDDPTAFRLLAVAYRALMAQETALLGGLKLTPENAAQVSHLTPQYNLLGTRFRQLLTSLNYAIQTTPPPKTHAARHELQRLNVEMFQLLLSANCLDLARDRLQTVIEGSDSTELSAEDRAQLSRDLAELNEQVKKVEEALSTLSTEQQLGPVQLATYAINQGAPGLAIHELEEAERIGTNPALVKPQLLDLYCFTGQPDKAVEMLGSGTIDDPSFGTEPGQSAMRQARVYLLLGNDDYAGTLLKKYAIQRLRLDRALRGLGSAQMLVKGELRQAVGSAVEIPAKVNLQADWEFEAALCRLEGGIPDEAAEHFTKALTLAPKMNNRPIIAYYLEKLGKPVPPLPDEAAPAVENGKAGESPKKDETTPADERGKAEEGPRKDQAKPDDEKGKAEENPKKVEDK